MSEPKEYTVKVYEELTTWHNKRGKFHREDGPAIELNDGTKYWYINGLPHRENGPAVEWSNGSKSYWLNGQLHREDGPAIEHSDGYKAWYINGHLHREDGPAVEWVDGYKEWWVNGKELTEEEFKARTKPCTIEDNIIEVDGKKYRLIEEK